jgi:hypothetical protein
VSQFEIRFVLKRIRMLTLRSGLDVRLEIRSRGAFSSNRKGEGKCLM